MTKTVIGCNYRAAEWRACRIKLVFREVHPLAEALLEGLCCDLRANYSCGVRGGRLQCSNSVEHDDGFCIPGPAIVKVFDGNWSKAQVRANATGPGEMAVPPGFPKNFLQ